jgi:phosphomannomutase
VGVLTAATIRRRGDALNFCPTAGFLDRDRAESPARYESGTPWATFDRLGPSAPKLGLDWHIEQVLSLDLIDRKKIAARSLHAVVDGCHSVGGIAVPRLLRELGLRVTELDCTPDGAFSRELEPLPENLGALSRATAAAGADFGIALDPDADRAAFVDHEGVPLGENTLALRLRS